MDTFIPRLVSLSSSASCDIFPNNTRTSFVNLLPTPIRVFGEDKIYIRLHSIDFAEAPVSEYLKIHIDEVCEQAKGQEYSKFAGGFSIPAEDRLTNEYGRHTFTNSPFLPLKNQEVQQIGVKIVNSLEEHIELTNSPQTVLIVEIMTNQQEEQFLVTCHSKHPDLYPSNSLSNFSSPLPCELKVGDYEVALANVVFPPMMEDEDRVAALYIDNSVININLSHCTFTIDFINLVRDKVNDLFDGVITFGVLDDMNYVEAGRAFLHNDPVRGVPVRVACNKTFAKCVGQLDGNILPFTLKRGRQIYFKGYPNLHWSLPNPSAILTCSAVQPGVSFGQPSKILQCIPVLKSDVPEENRLYEPRQLLFISATSFPIRSIDFQFLDPDGSPRSFIPYDRDRDNMYITLLFKKRNYSQTYA